MEEEKERGKKAAKGHKRRPRAQELGLMGKQEKLSKGLKP